MPALRRAGAQRSEVLRLVFDLGPVELWAGEGELAAQVPESELASPFVDAGEEEPWWAVIGNPLVRVEALETEPGVRLQFRPDAERPRRIVLVAAAGGIDWRIAPPAGAH